MIDQEPTIEGCYASKTGYLMVFVDAVKDGEVYVRSFIDGQLRGRRRMPIAEFVTQCEVIGLEAK